MTTVLTDRSEEITGLALTHDERSDVRAVVSDVMRSAPALVDHAGWLAHARSASCRLPLRLTEAIRSFRHDPGVDATLTITNLPIDADLLPQRSDRKSVV